MKSRSLFHILFSLVLIGLGVILILVNFGVISVEITDLIKKNWPALIALLGLKWFWDGIRPSGDGSWTMGSFLAIYGTLIVLGRNDVIDFDFSDIWTLWPLLLIYIGVHSLLFSKRKKRNGKKVKITFDHSDKEKYYSLKKNLVGDQNYFEENWTVEPLDLWSGVGNYYFDFTRSYIPEGNTPINIRGWVGDIRMIIPENLGFQVEASTKVGEIKIFNERAEGLKREIFYQSPNYHEATKKLTIKLKLKVGDIRIDQV
jgi:lia operon protein LiaF